MPIARAVRKGLPDNPPLQPVRQIEAEACDEHGDDRDRRRPSELGYARACEWNAVCGIADKRSKAYDLAPSTARPK